MSSKLLHLATCLVIFALYSEVRPEIYTAVTELEALIDTHKKLAYSLEEFVLRERKRLNILKRYLERFQTEHEIATRDVPSYLGNPINAFTLIKRLTVDLAFIEQKIREKTPFRKNRLMLYPKKEDVEGAAQAVAGLQMTYNLNITDMANGVLNGNFSQSKQEFQDKGTPLVTSDCFELGRAFYGMKKFKQGILWMMEALKKFDEDALPYPVTKAEIIEHISAGYFSLDDLNNALAWTKKNIASMTPDNPRYTRAKGTLEYYNQLITEKKDKDQEIDYNFHQNKNQAKEFLQNFYEKQYGAVCRGEMDLTTNISKRLKCGYLKKKHPYLLLAPMKMELLHIDPNIIMFHDVITNSQIKHIKKVAKSMLETDKVRDNDTEENAAPDRIRKIAWLNDSETTVTPILRKSIAKFTGLDLNYALPMQVVNYGVGGYNKPHYDFAKNPIISTTSQYEINLQEVHTLVCFRRKPKPTLEPEVDASTSREFKTIATIMLYLTDVAQGGATVFPELGLSIFPERGAALYWQNLHPSGQENLATKHAACPVLYGSKWVINQWIKEEGQEFASPCTKQPQRERSTVTTVISRSIPM